MPNYDVVTGDCRSALAAMPADHFDCCISSPPYYGLRKYLPDGDPDADKELGRGTLLDYLSDLVAIFRGVRRVLRPDGTLWVVIGDSYVTSPHGPGGRDGALPRAHRNASSTRGGNRSPIPGLKHKDLIGVPWRLAFALQADGWYLRAEVCWAKGNPLPESVHDRPTRSHETVFMLTRQPRYYYDEDAVAEPAVSDHDSGNGFHRPERVSTGRGSDEQWRRKTTRRRRSVWTVNTGGGPRGGNCRATFPERLVTPMVLASSRPGGRVIDPFCGSGTTGVAALRHGRSFTGVELSPVTAEQARQRLLTMSIMVGTADQACARLKEFLPGYLATSARRVSDAMDKNLLMAHHPGPDCEHTYDTMADGSALCSRCGEVQPRFGRTIGG